MFSLDNYAQFQATTHPLLEAFAGNQYGNNFQARGNHHHHQRPYSNLKASYRPLAAAGTNLHEIFNSGGGTGYGPSSSGYDAQHYLPAISAHSGGGSGWTSGHSGPSGGGTGYAAHPHPHPPERPISYGFGNIKRGRNSAMTALTLLSFFFFVNLLQSCLKEHMSTINPTVMVMTSGVVRNRYNKLAEMNSREHSTSSATTNTDGHIVIQPEDLVSAAASVVPMTVAPTVTIQSPYSDVVLNQQSSILESHLKLKNPYATPSTTKNTLVWDSDQSYPNKTLPTLENQRPYNQYDNDRHQEPAHGFSNQHEPVSNTHSWSSGGTLNGGSSAHSHYGSPSSVSSSNSYYDDRKTYYDRDRYNDRYDDRYFTRLY